MNSILDVIPQLAAYQPALLMLAILCLVVLIQTFLSAPLAFVKEEQVPGMPLRGDHNLLSFRVVRTHANSVESLGPFGFSLIVAVLAGVKPSLVNWLVGIHAAFRLAFWAVYYSGVGKVAGGVRTLTFVGGMVSNIVLTGAAIYVLLT